VPDCGAKMLVVADNDEPAAAALAARLARELWDMRDAATARLDPIDAGLDAAMEGGGLMVLADASDNPGGGAPCDSTFILRRVLDRGMTGIALGCFWDPQAVQFCREAGEGATFALRVGGKCGPASGDPVDLLATVRRAVAEHGQAGLSGGRSDCGASAWISAAGLDLVLISRRQQTFAPDAFTGLGLTLHDKRAVVVKSSQHFQAAFAPIARRVMYLAGPGALSFDYAALPYQRRTAPYWPRVADPFAS
jgi:microcystin degradation protein MlrC